MTFLSVGPLTEIRVKAAVKRGDFAEALYLLFMSETEYSREVEHYLQHRMKLGRWTSSFLSAARELQLLKKNATDPGSRDVSRALLKPFATQSEQAAKVLFQSAQRVSSVNAQRISSDLVNDRLEVEHSKVERLTEAARQAREAIALMTLSERGSRKVDDVGGQLRALAEATTELELLA